MAVNKLNPGMIESSDPYFGDLEHNTSIRATRPDGKEVSITLARLIELVNAGSSGQAPVVVIFDGGEMESDVGLIHDGGEMEDVVAVIHDGGEVIP